MKNNNIAVVITLPLLLVSACLAIAADEGSSRPQPPTMTAAQKACFTDNGLTAPGDGPRPTTRPDKSVMETVHSCLQANGLTMPDRPPPPGQMGRDPGDSSDSDAGSGSSAQ
jgi:hypothetical protein